jgi:uncharacterized iron-regulated membrane protein
MTNTKQQAKWIRRFRWLHRKIAIFLFIFFFIISITGFLLGWKKKTGLLAPTQKGVSAQPGDWLTMDSLQKLASNYLHDSVSAELSNELDRIDIRPFRGIVKFVFANHYWGLQLDCTTGKLLSIEKRRSDFIEDIHDGSILDRFFNTGENSMLGYTTIMGISLLMLTITGFWLWYGPKRLRKNRRENT